MTTRDLISFSERAAHDLGNPLTAISMALEMATDLAAAESVELHALLARMRRSTDRLTALVEQLPESARAWPDEPA